MVIRIDPLTKLFPMSDESVLFQNAPGNHLQIKIRKMSHVLYRLLKVKEIAGHGVQEYGGKDIIVFDLSHSDNAMIVTLEFRQHISQRGVIREVDIEGLDEKADLSICSLVFVQDTEAFEELMGR